MSTPDPSPELRARVLAAVGASPSMSRAQGRRRRGALIAAGFALMIPISMCLGGPGLRGRPVGYAFALALSWLAIASATSWAGVSRGRSMLGRTRGWRMLTAVATPIALLAVSVALGMVWPQMLHEAPGRHQRVLWFVAPPHRVPHSDAPLCRGTIDCVRAHSPQLRSGDPAAHGRGAGDGGRRLGGAGYRPSLCPGVNPSRARWPRRPDGRPSPHRNDARWSRRGSARRGWLERHVE